MIGRRDDLGAGPLLKRYQAENGRRDREVGVGGGRARGREKMGFRYSRLGVKHHDGVKVC